MIHFSSRNMPKYKSIVAQNVIVPAHHQGHVVHAGQHLYWFQVEYSAESQLGFWSG